MVKLWWDCSPWKLSGNMPSRAWCTSRWSLAKTALRKMLQKYNEGGRATSIDVHCQRLQHVAQHVVHALLHAHDVQVHP